MLVKQNTDFFSREKQRIGIFYNQPKNQLKIKHNYFFRNPFLRNIAEPKILCDENFLFPSQFFHYCSVVLHYYHYLCYKVKYITIVPFIKRKSYFFFVFQTSKGLRMHMILGEYANVDGSITTLSVFSTPISRSLAS